MTSLITVVQITAALTGLILVSLCFLSAGRIAWQTSVSAQTTTKRAAVPASSAAA